MCVFETSESVSRWLHLFWATHNYFAPKLHCFQFNCSYEASLGAVLLTSLKLFRLSAPVFGAKYNIFQLSAPVGEKTWIISIWLQFKCTYFEPTATISILLHLFWANVTGIETIWFFMFWANFNNFNLTAPFLSGVSSFFCYALPYFEQISQNNGPFRINFNSFQLAVCVCVWDIWACFKMTAPVPSHTQLFRSKAALLSIQLQLWGLVVRYFWQVSIFRLCQLSCTDEKNQTNCIAKILISAWRVVGNLLLINVER